MMRSDISLIVTPAKAGAHRLNVLAGNHIQAMVPRLRGGDVAIGGGAA